MSSLVVRDEPAHVPGSRRGDSRARRRGNGVVREPRLRRFPQPPLEPGPHPLSVAARGQRSQRDTEGIHAGRVLLARASGGREPGRARRAHAPLRVRRHLPDRPAEGPPGEVAAQAYLDHTDANVAARMAELKRQGVKAFRLRLLDPWRSDFPDSHPIMKAYQVAAAERLVICPLTNPDWLPQLDRLSADVPEDHGGHRSLRAHRRRWPGPDAARAGDDQARGRRQPGQAGPAPRVHVKVSAFYALGRRTPPYDDMVPVIKELVGAYGPERLMWGSDCPYQLPSPHSYRASIALVRDRLDGLSEDDREWLLRKTAERASSPDGTTTACPGPSARAGPPASWPRPTCPSSGRRRRPGASRSGP